MTAAKPPQTHLNLRSMRFNDAGVDLLLAIFLAFNFKLQLLETVDLLHNLV